MRISKLARPIEWPASVDLRTGERFAADGAAEGDPWLVTSPGVAGAAEKRRLAADYQAGLVDMEAAAIARLAAMRGIPFQVLQGCQRWIQRQPA